MLQHPIRLTAALLVLAATPAMAEQPAAKPLPFHLHVAPKPTPKPVPVPPGPAYEAAVAKVAAGLKPGMDANQMAAAFSKAGKGLPGARATYVDVTPEIYTLPDKSRVEIQLAFYRTSTMATKHVALMAFKAPDNDFTGGHSKLLAVTLLTSPKEPVIARQNTAVKSVHDINKRCQYKFSPAL